MSTTVIIAVLILSGALLASLFVARRTSRDVGNDSSKVIKIDFNEAQQFIQMKMRERRQDLAIVNIWATWCEPCRREMPELVQFAKESAYPLVLISADNESDREAVQKFLSAHGADFESLLIKGSQDRFISEWQKQTSVLSSPWSMTLPATFVLDSSGTIQSLLATETTAKALAEHVESVKKRLHSKSP